jgi:predicted DNA-binding transcriptional regulator AlpA
MIVKRQWIDWRTLVRLGYPYSRQHTYRLMAAGRFPKASKLGDDRSSRIVWHVADVRDWASRYGLTLDYSTL